ncbi:unnamed protein product [Rangifer tarandus platyrhynchus]|uniref:Uncharacterized protein n=1 Tax=Rangifer tarandus platyrhynchus TaxID=3082113 RepID=A0ABN8YFT2_RANTA|nr:unnamed protein product [Rangifer tarandus platyrhynchus]
MFGSGSRMAPYNLKAPEGCGLQRHYSREQEWDSSPRGSSVPGILQERTLEWVAISFSNVCLHAELLQLCPTLCDPMDSSPPGSSVHRILQVFRSFWHSPSSSFKMERIEKMSS